MNFTTTQNPQKQVGIVGRVGPAFSVDELANAHRLLDLYRVPRLINDDHPISLAGRIAWLGAQIEGLETQIESLEITIEVLSGG